MSARTAFRRAQLLVIGGVFLSLGAFFIVVSVCVALTVQLHPALLALFCIGLGAAVLGWVGTFHGAYSVVVSREGVTLEWVTGGERVVTWEQVTSHRNLAGTREMERLDVYNPDPGKLQAITLWVLLRYGVNGQSRFALFYLPALGPIEGRLRDYRTGLDDRGAIRAQPWPR